MSNAYEDMNLVWRASGQLDAEMIKSLLQSFGIIAYSSQESLGSTFGFTLTPLGEVEIYVRDNDVTDANRILDDYRNGFLDEERD